MLSSPFALFRSKEHNRSKTSLEQRIESVSQGFVEFTGGMSVDSIGGCFV